MSLQGKVATITVGNAALFLASDEDSSIAGTELVDGGYIAA
jgi:enoyl-[acyl-carrier-protein] reductase (NADH)